MRTLYYRISKISNEIGRNYNFRALARKLSFLPTSLDISDIQHYSNLSLCFHELEGANTITNQLFIEANIHMAIVRD